MQHPRRLHLIYKKHLISSGNHSSSFAATEVCLNLMILSLSKGEKGALVSRIHLTCHFNHHTSTGSEFKSAFRNELQRRGIRNYHVNQGIFPKVNLNNTFLYSVGQFDLIVYHFFFFLTLTFF